MENSINQLRYNNARQYSYQRDSPYQPITGRTGNNSNQNQDSSQQLEALRQQMGRSSNQLSSQLDRFLPQTTAQQLPQRFSNTNNQNQGGIGYNNGNNTTAPGGQGAAITNQPQALSFNNPGIGGLGHNNDNGDFYWPPGGQGGLGHNNDNGDFYWPPGGQGAGAIGNNRSNYTQNLSTNNAWQTDREDIMLYGDPVFNRIVAIRPSTMQNVGNIHMPGQEIYAADHITDDKSYVMARGSNFMNILERDSQGEFVFSGQIRLPFHPRTGAKNLTLGLELVTGTDKPMFGLVDINSDKLVASGGLNQVTQGNVGNFDGELATGHGIWLNDNQFVLPDRANKLIHLYSVTANNTATGDSNWHVELQDTLNLPSSVHTVHHGQDANTFYIPLEGSPQNGVAAGFSELILQGDQLILGRTANVPGTDLAAQGTHHPGLHPDGKHAYVGSNEGFVHVVDTDSMNVIKSIPAGKGAGHITFIPERNLALVTNHHDTFVTAIDMTTHEHIKDIHVATDSPDYDTALQAHTGRVSPDKQYFYNFASDSGTFFRINLDTLSMDGQLYTGGTPKQASQPGELTNGAH